MPEQSRQAYRGTQREEGGRERDVFENVHELQPESDPGGAHPPRFDAPAAHGDVHGNYAYEGDPVAPQMEEFGSRGPPAVVAGQSGQAVGSKLQNGSMAIE